MNQDLRMLKELLLKTGQFDRKKNGWYRGTNCPYCGDSKRHFYIHIDLSDDSPIAWKCFKCGKGLIDKAVLDCYGIEWKGMIPRGKSSRSVRRNEDTNTFIMNQDDLFDMDYMKKCCEYIESRLGIEGIGIDELKMFGVVLNPESYARMYLNGVLNNYQDRVWFITSNGMLLGRSMLKKKDGWEKYTGEIESNGSRMLYNVKKSFDLTKDITVCICEGVMDCLGLLYHGDIENGLYVAVLGRDYMAGLEYVMSKGIFGDSVHVRIYKDSDVDRVIMDQLKCRFFKSVDVYYNAIGKDYGVFKDEIELSKCDSIWNA